MESVIEKDLAKFLKVAKKDNHKDLEEHIIFLLEPIENKIHFLQNKKSYTGQVNAQKIADLIMFENNEDVKILIGKKSTEIDNLCKEYIDNKTSRRQIQVNLNECTSLYNKTLNHTYDNIRTREI